MWDPETYLAFEEERRRPFLDLVARVGAEAPGDVVDLGCGTGHLTAELAARWPAARVVGVDRSPDMLAAAAPLGGGRLGFEEGDVASWAPAGPVDVVASNAVLHWVPGHRALLARWVGWLRPAGWLAFQVPGNFAAPSHALVREVAARPEWRAALDGVPGPSAVADPADYAGDLATLGCRVDAWETTYLHVLHGADPVLTWARGTALRPLLARLGPAEGEAFLAELAPRLRAAYPPRPYGTPFPFRRVFVVAQRGAP